MALQNLHEMIRNLSAYIKSLEVVCENGVKLAKNFEYLLSPGPTSSFSGAGAPPPSANLDSDVLTQSVATWELAQKVATADANALISELLPLLQCAVQDAMKDPSHSSNSYEVFRSCFSAFFQIQWRFCSLYIQCSSCPARSPTTTSFSSSGDRRESTESCMSSFSVPRSSISGFSSGSSSPSPQISHHHTQHFGHHHSRSRNSSPSVKFTPSQPPSPLYSDSAYPYLFRRWSAHTHNYNNNTSSMGSGPSANRFMLEDYNSGGSCGSSGGSCSSGLSTGLSFCRRWSVPASSSSGTHSHSHAASTCSGDRRESTDNSKTRKTDGIVDSYDYGLLDAINLLSTKPPSPIPVKILPPAEEEVDDFFTLDQQTIPSSGNSRRRVIYAPSESIPGVVLTTCGSDAETLSLENLQITSHQSLRVPFSGDTPSSNSVVNSIIASPPSGQQSTGEYSLFGFGNSPSPTQGT